MASFFVVVLLSCSCLFFMTQVFTVKLLWKTKFVHLHALNFCQNYYVGCKLSKALTSWIIY